MSVFKVIVRKGNRPPFGSDLPRGENFIKCSDGFTLYVNAGEGMYCSPRPGRPPLGEVDPSYPGPYTHVEVGFPSQTPTPWAEWAEFCEDPSRPTETVYGYVPVELVQALIDQHGGEAS